MLQRLLTERPKFHAEYNVDGVIAAEAFSFAIGEDMLEWILGHVEPGWRTLETGCGYSTVSFAIAGSEHTTISPYSPEHDSIKKWCAENGIDTSRIQFIAAESEMVMQSLSDSPLDLVLIDGKHAFPVPFIDWFYTADRVKKGGYMIVDDTHLITGTILRDFLHKEIGRWELDYKTNKTAVFQKTTEESVIKGVWWRQQPFCLEPREEELRSKSFTERVVRKLGKTLLGPDHNIFRPY